MRSISVLLLAAASGFCASPRLPGRLLAGRLAPLDPVLEARTWSLHGLVERRHLPEIGVHVLEVPETSFDAVRQSLTRTGLFDYVEPDYYAEQGDATPNDTYYDAQWHLGRIGSPVAWLRTTGNASVVVAVIDSGVDASHPDLAGKLVGGWNFVEANADTSDLTGHGTEVAGTVGAATNNEIGIAGVTWNSMIMPLRVVDGTSFAAYSDVAAAIQYAVDRHVRVINVSIGGTEPSMTLQNAVNYAWNHGALIVAAAMNSAANTPNYPAACNHAIAVSATDERDRLATFSNYGSWLTFAAPGNDILTTEKGGGYGYVDGTSFAAPITAGVAALVLAANSELTNQQVVDILKQSADDLGQPGFDSYFGWGRVNAGKAVQLATPALPSPAPAPPVVPVQRVTGSEITGGRSGKR